MMTRITNKTSVVIMFAVLAAIAALTTPARADAVADWNAIAVQAAMTSGTRPAASGNIDIAMVHTAIYDAVQAIGREYEPYYVDIPNASGNPVAATAKAARDVLVSRFPAQATALDVTYQNYLAANGIAANDPGIAVGATAAAAIIALRACDGSFPSPAPPPFIGSTAIGAWRPTPPALSAMNPGPWQGQVTPFALTRPFQFRSKPPPALTSRRYARDYNEVKELGSLTGSSRTARQTDQAYFYAGNTVVMMHAVVRDMATKNALNISDSSRLFALTTISQADAAIATWNDKAFHNFWRPITAIQNGHLDGNPRTTGDPTWTSLIANPPYPDYGSGACSLVASTMRTLRNFFGTDRMDFSITTTNTGPTIDDTREFKRFSDATQEVVEARMYLGIHFRFADEVSETLGNKVADWTFDNYLKPVRVRRPDWDQTETPPAVNP